MASRIIENFETLAEWQPHANGSSITLETTTIKLGSGAIKFTKDAAGIHGGIHKNGVYIDFTEHTIDRWYLNASAGSVANISRGEVLLQEGDAHDFFTDWDDIDSLTALPSAGVWTYDGSGTEANFVEIAGAELKLRDILSGGLNKSAYYTIDLSASVGASDSIVFHGETKVSSGTNTDLNVIAIYNSVTNQYIKASIQDSEITMHDGQVHTATMTNYRYFQLELTEDGYNVWWDDEIVLSGDATGGSGVSRIDFGKIVASADWQITYYKHVKYAVIPNGNTPWPHQFLASSGFEPNSASATPAWALVGTDQAAIVSSILELTNSIADTGKYFISLLTHGGIESNDKVIVEANMKVDSGTAVAKTAWMHVDADTSRVELNIVDGTVNIIDGDGTTAITHNTTSDYSVYRLYVDGANSTYKLLINGILKATGTPQTISSAHLMYFGKDNSSTDGKKSYWKYVNWFRDPEATYSVYQFDSIVSGWNTLDFNPRFPDYEIGLPSRSAVTRLVFRVLSNNPDEEIVGTIVDAFTSISEISTSKEPIVLMEWDLDANPIEDFETVSDWLPHADATPLAANIADLTEGSQSMTLTKNGLNSIYSGIRKVGLDHDFSQYDTVALDTILDDNLHEELTNIELLLEETEGYNATRVPYTWAANCDVEPDVDFGTLVGVDHAASDGDIVTISNCSTDECYYWTLHGSEEPYASATVWTQARVKVEAGTTNYVHGFKIVKEATTVEVWLIDGNIRVTVGGTTYADHSTDTTTDYVNIKAMVDKDGNFVVKLVDNIIAAGTGATSAADEHIEFGKFTATDTNKAAYWDYFRYVVTPNKVTYNPTAKPDDSSLAHVWTLVGTDQATITNGELIIENSLAAECYYERYLEAANYRHSHRAYDSYIETRFKVEAGYDAEFIHMGWGRTNGGVFVALDDSGIEIFDGGSFLRIDHDTTAYTKLRLEVKNAQARIHVYVDDVLAGVHQNAAGPANGQLEWGKHGVDNDNLKLYVSYFELGPMDERLEPADEGYHGGYLVSSSDPDSAAVDPQWTLAGVDHATSSPLVISSAGTDLCNYTVDTAVAENGGWATDGIVWVRAVVKTTAAIHNDTCQLRVHYDTNLIQLHFHNNGIYNSGGTLLGTYEETVGHQIDIRMTALDCDVYIDGEYSFSIQPSIESAADYYVSFGKFNADDDDVAQTWYDIIWGHRSLVRSIYQNTANILDDKNTFIYNVDSPDTTKGTPNRSSVQAIVLRSKSYSYHAFAAEELNFDNLRDGDLIKRYAKVAIISSDGRLRWKGKVLAFGDITKNINNKRGNYELSDLDINLEDSSAEFTQIWQDHTAGLKNTPVRIKFGYINEPYINYRTIFDGILEDCSFDKYSFSLSATDVIPKYFNRLPNQYITEDIFPDAPEDSLGKVASVIAGTVDDTFGALPAIPVGFEVFVHAGVNDKINFKETDGGAEKTATLGQRRYNTPSELATELSAKMTDATGVARTYTCTFDTDKRKFKISHDEAGGTFLEILWSTGTNDDTSAGGILGFDIEFDSTGSKQYTGQRILWNRFIVARHHCKDDANAKVFIDEDEITSAIFDFDFKTGTPDETILEDFETAADWTTWQQAANIAANITNKTSGGQSISFDKTGGATVNAGIFKDPNVDYSAIRKFAVDVYIPDAATLANIAKVILLLGTDVNLSNFETYVAYTATYSWGVGWNTVVWDTQVRDNLNGTFDKSDVRRLQFHITTDDAADLFTAVLLDNFRSYDGTEDKWTEVLLPFHSSGIEDIRVNISGLTSDGTSSGTQLTDPTDFFKQTLIQLVNYPASLIDDAAFVAAKTISVARSYAIGGAIIDDIEWDSFVEDFCKNFNMDFWINREGKLAVGFFIPDIEDVDLPNYTDVLHILKASFSFEPRLTELVNKIKYEYKQNYIDGDWKRYDETDDKTSIAVVGRTYDWEEGTLQLNWVRSGTVAKRVAQLFLTQLSGGDPTANISLPLIGWDEDLTNKIRISHTAGPNYETGTDGILRGYNSRLHRVASIRYNLDDYTSEIILRDYQRLGGRCFFLGNRDWPAVDLNYLTTTENKQDRYGYLADRDTEQFSNGDDGKRLC